MPHPELDVSLPDLESWKTLCREQPFVCDPGASREIVEQAKRQGIVSPHFGSIGPEQVKVGGPNYRESFFAGGLNPRARALLDELAGMPKASQRFGLRIFAPEALSPFALRLRGLYPLFYGSEYLPDKAERERLFPIPHQDLESLSLPDAHFDIVFCNDLFEHLPDVPRALSELARVLTSGGVLLSTFPFAYNQVETIVKARREGGTVQVIGEPEYHANPVDSEAGSLVFQIPGWDILETVRAAGFSRAEMRFVSSGARGICATELAGIFFLRAVR